MSERGKYSLLLDNVFIKYNDTNIYIGTENGLLYKATSSSLRECLDLLSKSETRHLINLVDLVNMVKSLSHLNNYNNLTMLLYSAFKTDYAKFCNLFYSPLHNHIFNSDIVYQDNPIQINIINNMIFLIENKELFIDSIREKGYNVNEGP